MKILTVKGVSVYLHFTFLFFVAWLAVLYITTGLQWEQLALSALFLLAVFASIILHEYGHAFVASLYGINAKTITIYPIGGVASIEKLPGNPRQELLISGAGPFVSVCLAAFLFLFSSQRFTIQNLSDYSGVLNAKTFIFSLAFVNMALAVFNLIPAFPLDGGRILRALLAYKYNYIKATAIAATTGKIVALFIIAAGLLTMNLVLALVGVFIIIFAQAEESYLQLKALVKAIPLREILMYDYNSIDGNLTVNEAANILSNNHAPTFLVMLNGIPVGTLNRMEVMKAVSELEYNKKVTDLMDNGIVPLQADVLVEDVLEELSENDKKIYPVFDKDQFVGVVNFQHVIEYLLIHKASLRDKDYNKTRSLAELIH